MRRPLQALGLIPLILGSPAAWAGSTYVPPPTKSVAAARLATDQKTITTDKTAITSAQTSLKNAQTVVATDQARLTSDRQQLAANYAQVKNLESQLAAALSKRDLTTAAILQGQIGAAKASGKALETDIATVNTKLRADQAAVNKANEAVILANRKLTLDTNQFNADTYYAQWGK